MRMQILSVGRLKAGPERELYDRYAERFEQTGRQLGITALSLVEIPEARSAWKNARKSAEAEQLLSRAENDATLILLDERGKDMSSQEFAEMISRFQADGVRDLAFALGGPDGHGDEVSKTASRKIRFGQMTWPHQIARILLVEQLYRSNTIRLGHPYHRD